MPGDQQAAELLAVVGDPVDDRAVGLDHWHVVFGELAQQAVLAQHEPVGGLLDREHLDPGVDEPHDVPRDAARHVHDPRDPASRRAGGRTAGPAARSPSQASSGCSRP